jgi:integrase
MKLKHRSGLRWGELTALQAGDVEFEPARVIHVRRAVEQGAGGPATLKTPKNGKVRTSIFPKGIADEVRDLVDEVQATGGSDALLFPAVRGDIMRRSSFQQIWARAADAAGWPMTTPLRRSAGYGDKNKGWRWTGAARWSPHDLRHVGACWMLFDVGLDPAFVADKLGHADPAFTIKRYVGVRGDADATANRLNRTVVAPDLADLQVMRCVPARTRVSQAVALSWTFALLHFRGYRSVPPRNSEKCRSRSGRGGRRGKSNQR